MMPAQEPAAPRDERDTEDAQHEEHPGGVLIAVDGSDSAGIALDWAVRDAVSRRVPLTIAHTYHWPVAGIGQMGSVGMVMERMEQDSAELVSAAAERARSQAPDLSVETFSLLGPPLPALVDLSEGRDVLVVGSRGLGGFKGMLLGSVSTGLVTQAKCPVVVVRGQAATSPDAPVIVGVEGTDESSDPVLDAAFEAAERLHCPVRAVHSWQNPAAAVHTADGGELVDEAERWRQSVVDELTARVATTAERFPTVSVDTTVLPGEPAATLLDEAEAAQLLVVGTRGRGGLKSTLLGSTSLAMTHHAPCPIMVVR